MANLWNCEEPIVSLDGAPEVPAWIDQEITPLDVAAINQGGCDSGAYMPAVTYHQAAQTMRDHGDEIFDALDDPLGIVKASTLQSWDGWACALVSAAVEQWAHDVEAELSDLLDEREAEEES